MSTLETFFSEVTAAVNAELDWLIPETGQPPQKLRDAVRWSLMSGGKHFRPALVFAVGRAFDCDDAKLVRTAAAVEMIHTYSLIHDDLPSMDDDDLRRGRATCHKKFGEATAILAGDALQVLAFQAVSDDKGLSSETRIELISRLAQAAGKMVVGQQLDLEAEGKELSIEQIEHIHRNKTGALIGFSATAGAIIGGADATRLESIRRFGDRLGLLFQITDDLLDVEGSAERTGKRVQKDADRGKLTYPGLLGVEESRRRAQRLCEEACRCLSPLGPAADRLAQLARYVVERDR